MMQNTKSIPIGKQLRRLDFDELSPSRHVVSLEEFEQLKKEGDEDCLGLSYDEYCDIEKQGWSDMARALFRKPFEALDIVPPQRFWWGGVKKISMDKVETMSQLGTVFENAIIENRDGDEFSPENMKHRRTIRFDEEMTWDFDGDDDDDDEVVDKEEGVIFDDF